MHNNLTLRFKDWHRQTILPKKRGHNAPFFYQKNLFSFRLAAKMM